MKWDFTGTILTGMVLAGSAILIGACASKHDGEESDSAYPAFKDDVVVMVHFYANGCPKSAYPEKFEIIRSRKVSWQSVGADDKPIEREYSIYFDPFMGRSISAKQGDHGLTPSRTFSQAAQELVGVVEYKYTIVSDSDKTCKPLDPRFRLR